VTAWSFLKAVFSLKILNQRVEMTLTSGKSNSQFIYPSLSTALKSVGLVM